MRCRWCDTPYPSGEPEGERRPVGELVDGAVASGVRHVVVTGGEPLLQREIGLLTGGLAAAGLHITVESAGTVDPSFDCDLLSLSPKPPTLTLRAGIATGIVECALTRHRPSGS